MTSVWPLSQMEPPWATWVSGRRRGAGMSFRVEKDVMVPMRDGTTLATDPRIPGGPAPALLVRLPYGKDMLPGTCACALHPSIFTLLEAG